MSKSYNVDIAEFPDYLAPHDSFAIFTPIAMLSGYLARGDSFAISTPTPYFFS
jgi:hypothetical protein